MVHAACANARLLEGGGSILPTETGFFTRKEQHNHWRLGCQVKIRENLTVKVPEAVMGIKKWECEVVSNRNVATFIKEFVVKLPDGESMDFLPGGYIQIDVPKYETSFRDFIIEEQFRVTGINIKCGISRFKQRGDFQGILNG